MALSDGLVKRGYEIVGIDLEDRHGRFKVSGLLKSDNFTFRQLDLAKENINVSEFNDIDIIFHFAALPHVDYSFFYPHRVVKNNMDSLLTITELACTLGKPLILASSVEVYGGREDRIYTEDDTPTPLSPYVASKVASEAIVSTYVETKGLSATIFRFTNLYGQWQAPDRLLPRFIAQLITGKEITVEKGTNRDFVFIEDAPRFKAYLYAHCHRPVILHSFIYEAMLVASGKIAATVLTGSGAHDSASVKLIVEEAGGKVTDLFGEEQRYDRQIKGTIASNGSIHQK